MLTIDSNWRQLLLLLVLAALFLLLMTVPAHGATAGSSDPYSPERCVMLDIPWMSPPTVIPQTGSASSRVMDQGVSMQDSSPDAGANFTWKLRYPIDVQRWPILVLRYRASSLAQGAAYGDRVLQLDLRSGPTNFQSLTAIRLNGLAIDGALHEVRRDLRGVAAGSMVEAIRFTFHASGGTGRLDVVQMQFEQLAPTVPAEPLAKASVPFTVKDAAGNPVAGAEVRVGILERSNWTTIGQTGRDGQVRLTTALGPGIGGNAAPVEAAVLSGGYLTEYVAPIQPPVGDAGIQVTLKPAAEAAAPPAAVNPTPVQPTTGYDTGDGWTTPNVTYPPRTYDSGYNYGNDYYDGGYYGSGYYGSAAYGSRYYGGYYGSYGSGWWIPWYSWPGSVGSVIVVSKGDDDCDRDDGHHGKKGGHHWDGKGPGHWTAPGGRGRDGNGTLKSPIAPLRPGDSLAAVWGTQANSLRVNGTPNSAARSGDAARGTQANSPRVSATPNPTARSGDAVRGSQGNSARVNATPNPTARPGDAVRSTPRASAAPAPVRSGGAGRNVQGPAPTVKSPPTVRSSPQSGVSRGSSSPGVVRSTPARGIGQPGPGSGWSAGGGRGAASAGSARAPASGGGGGGRGGGGGGRGR